MSTNNVNPHMSANTLRGAFGAGVFEMRAWVRAHMAPMLFYGLLTGASRSLAAAMLGQRKFTAGDMTIIFIATLVSMVMGVGLYRAVWEGMQSHPVRFSHLWWGFAAPSRWALPLAATVIAVPSVIIVMIFLASSGHSAAWMAVTVVAESLFGLVSAYAFALTARLELGPTRSLRAALGVFRKNKRRWIALPVMMTMVTSAVDMLMRMAYTVGASYLVKLFFAAPLVRGALLVVLFAVCTTVISALCPLSFGAIMAAAGNLVDDGGVV